MKIFVLFFGPARLLTGRDEQDLELSDGSTVADAVSVLFCEHPRLQAIKDCLRYAADTEYVEATTPLSSGCTLALIPPVQGG